MYEDWHAALPNEKAWKKAKWRVNQDNTGVLSSYQKPHTEKLSVLFNHPGD